MRSSTGSYRQDRMTEWQTEEGLIPPRNLFWSRILEPERDTLNPKSLTPRKVRDLGT
jgi:hypothetical protein